MPLPHQPCPRPLAPGTLALPARRPQRGLALRLTLAAALSIGGAVHAEPLALHAAVQAAERHSLALVAADAAARAAGERAVAAAQRPDPVLRLALDNLPVDGPERFSTTRDFMTMRSIGVMQTFTGDDKRRARADWQAREADAARAERRQRAAELRRDAASAWFERRAQEQRTTLLQAQLAEARSQVLAAEAAARGGRGTQADWLAARDGVAQLEQALIGAEAERANARRTLARWTGLPETQALADAPPLDRHAGAPHPPAATLDRHPALVQLRAREAAAAAGAEAARQEREPDWSAELMFSQRGSRYSNMVSLALSLPLPWDRPQRQDRELAARLAQVDGLRALREEQARETLDETERWQRAWRAGLAQLALIDRERLPLARERAELALAAYRGGGAALAPALEARRLALALALERVAIELDTARLWSRLEFQIPADTAGTPPEGATP